MGGGGGGAGWFNCVLAVIWLLVFCVSSSWCHELVSDFDVSLTNSVNSKYKVSLDQGQTQIFISI